MPDDTATIPDEPEIVYYPDNRPDKIVNDRNQRLAGICKANVGVDRLHYVGHFVNGVPTFSVDVLRNEILAPYLESREQPDHSAGSGGGDAGPPREKPTDPEPLRRALRELGRMFNYDMGERDKELSQLRTGRLMRTILHMEHGGVFWYWIHENEYLVGLTLGGHTVDTADRSMASIAEEILASIRRPPRNYGGFLLGITMGDTGPTPLSGAKTQRSLRASRASKETRDVDALIARCRDALNPRDLHYVAYFAEGVWQFSVDVFDNSPNTAVFGGLEGVQRRAYCERIGQNLQFSTGQLDRRLDAMTRHLRGRLVRTVLDVESGALFHHPLGPGHYLVGVTLFQARVAHADDRIRRLVDDLRADPTFGWPRGSEVA